MCNTSAHVCMIWVLLAMFVTHSSAMVKVMADCKGDFELDKLTPGCRKMAKAPAIFEVPATCFPVRITLEAGHYSSEIGWGIQGCNCTGTCKDGRGFADKVELIGGNSYWVDVCLEFGATCHLITKDSYGDGWNLGRLRVEHLMRWNEFTFTTKAQGKEAGNLTFTVPAEGGCTTFFANGGCPQSSELNLANTSSTTTDVQTCCLLKEPCPEEGFCPPDMHHTNLGQTWPPRCNGPCSIEEDLNICCEKPGQVIYISHPREFAKLEALSHDDLLVGMYQSLTGKTKNAQIIHKLLAILFAGKAGVGPLAGGPQIRLVIMDAEWAWSAVGTYLNDFVGRFMLGNELRKRPLPPMRMLMLGTYTSRYDSDLDAAAMSAEHRMPVVGQSSNMRLNDPRNYPFYARVIPNEEDIALRSFQILGSHLKCKRFVVWVEDLARRDIMTKLLAYSNFRDFDVHIQYYKTWWNDNWVGDQYPFPGSPFEALLEKVYEETKSYYWHVSFMDSNPKIVIVPRRWLERKHGIEGSGIVWVLITTSTVVGQDFGAANLNRAHNGAMLWEDSKFMDGAIIIRPRAETTAQGQLLQPVIDFLKSETGVASMTSDDFDHRLLDSFTAERHNFSDPIFMNGLINRFEKLQTGSEPNALNTVNAFFVAAHALRNAYSNGMQSFRSKEAFAEVLNVTFVGQDGRRIFYLDRDLDGVKVNVLTPIGDINVDYEIINTRYCIETGNSSDGKPSVEMMNLDNEPAVARQCHPPGNKTSAEGWQAYTACMNASCEDGDYYPADMWDHTFKVHEFSYRRRTCDQACQESALQRMTGCEQMQKMGKCDVRVIDYSGANHTLADFCPRSCGSCSRCDHDSEKNSKEAVMDYIGCLEEKCHDHFDKSFGARCVDYVGSWSTENKCAAPWLGDLSQTATNPHLDNITVAQLCPTYCSPRCRKGHPMIAVPQVKVGEVVQKEIFLNKSLILFRNCQQEPPPSEVPECGVGRYYAILTAACANCSLGRYSDGLQATECQNCPGGFYADTIASSYCTACAPGTSSSDVASHSCNACIAGRFTDSISETSCKACSPGMYTSTAGLSQCTACEIGTYKTEAMSDSPTCMNCTSNLKTRYQGSTSISDCGCAVGNYLVIDGNESRCKECVPGIRCEHFGGMPLVDVGHFMYPSASRSVDNLQVYKCMPASGKVCTGQANAITDPVCGERMTDLNCGLCEDGYSRSDDECLACETQEWKFPVAFLFFFLLCGFFHGLWNRKAAHVEAGETVLASVTFGMTLGFIQQMGIFERLHFSWPEEFKDILNFFEVFIFNFDLLAPACTFPQGLATSYMLSMSFPLVITLIFFVWYFLAKILNVITKNKFPAFNIPELANTLGMILQAIFISIAAATVSLLECYPQKYVGISTLRSYPYEVCWEATHWKMVPICICGCIFYIIGIMSALTYAAASAPRRYVDPNFRTSIRFLVFKFCPNKWWYGIFLLLRSLALAMVTVVEPQDGYIQFFYMLTILIASLCLHLVILPYSDQFANNLETAELSFLLAILGIGSWFITERDPEHDATLAVVLLVLFAACAIILFAVFCYACFVAQFPGKIKSMHETKVEEVVPALKAICGLVLTKGDDTITHLLNEASYLDRENIYETVAFMMLELENVQNPSVLRIVHEKDTHKHIVYTYMMMMMMTLKIYAFLLQLG